MHNTDSIQRFLFEHANIKGEIVHLNNIYQTILQQRQYPKQVQTLLGEAMLACVILTASIKFEGEISIQFHGDKRLPLLLVQSNNKLEMRAVAKFDSNFNEDFNDAFLNGKMVINITYASSNYQSVIPINSVSMAENLMQYFILSEQITSQVFFAVNEDKAAGMLLQLMPGKNTMEREQFWEYAVKIGETITNNELFNLENTDILFRLYHETEIRLFDSKPIKFKCNCDNDKMRQVLHSLGKEETNKLLVERGNIEVTCDFCNQNYTFDAIDIDLIFRK